ncbi:MAG TPA: homoserine dehydrogenase [Thermoanaerobaculia bacterium]|jgi:homoserine dehydrogenase|nr:homoserine dehydrogenase [Thermoanaerobaculia bacterium]
MQTSTEIPVVIGSEADLHHAVHAIYGAWRAGRAVVAVVSPQEPIADDLLQRAEQLGLPSQPGALAALLVHALDRSGLPATLVPPFQESLLPTESRGIVVVPGATEHAQAVRTAPGGAPLLRVALLGCGTVGGGVLARLLARPDLFRVTGVAVRDLERERPGVPRGLLVRDAAALVRQEADVVVELFGGTEPARSLIVDALESGRSVVTANKALLATDVGALTRLAGRRGASLRFSASVGGALPALEAVRRAAAAGRVQSISGVLNGTCNDVLDRCAAGLAFDDALAAAQEAGYAEADPLLDLDGSDSAQKLALLAREAFGTVLDWRRIPRRGILGLDRSALETAARRGQAVRLVATCERTAAGLRASVQPLEIPHGHLFARARGADNALRIESRDGRVTDLAARGAGRWPTTEAVLADLFDLAAERTLEEVA